MKLNLLLLFSLCFITFPGKSQLNTIDEIALIILHESPEYKVSSKSLDTFSENARTLSNLPDPEIAGEYLFAPEGEPNRWGAEVSWNLEWPGVYGARKNEADRLLNSMSKNRELELRERLFEIKSILYEIVLSKKKLEVIDQIILTNDSIYNFAEQAAKAGELTVLDLNKIRLDNATIRGARTVNEQELETKKIELSAILGSDCSTLLNHTLLEFSKIEIPLGIDIAELALNSPEIALSQAEIEAAKASGKTVKMESLPSVSFGYKHAFEDNIHFNGATLGISVPLFSAKNKSKAAKYALAEAELKKESKIKSVETDLSLKIESLKILKQQIEEIEPLLFRTDVQSLLLNAYEKGVITMIDFLTERNYYTTAIIDFYDLRYSAAKTQLEIEKYTGIYYK